MLLKHLLATMRIVEDFSSLDLIKLVPEKYRKKVLAEVKWYNPSGALGKLGTLNKVAEGKIVQEGNVEKVFNLILAKEGVNRPLKRKEKPTN